MLRARTFSHSLGHFQTSAAFELGPFNTVETTAMKRHRIL